MNQKLKQFLEMGTAPCQWDGDTLFPRPTLHGALGASKLAPLALVPLTKSQIRYCSKLQYYDNPNLQNIKLLMQLQPNCKKIKTTKYSS